MSVFLFLFLVVCGASVGSMVGFLIVDWVKGRKRKGDDK